MILGGTGLLGQHTALAMLAQGDAPQLVALNADDELLPALASGLHEAGLPSEITTANIWECSDAQLVELLRGTAAVVYALGPDDRNITETNPPGHYERYLAAQTERVARACHAAGVENLVVLGSYFTAWARSHPEFASHHPYVRARQHQAARAIAAGGGRAEGGTDVSIIEIPYVFGAVPGRAPHWKTLLFEPQRRMPIVWYPAGGSSVVTAAQVGAVVAAASQRGRHGVHYPISDVDWTWAELIRQVRLALGLKSRKVHTVPRRLIEPLLWLVDRWLRRRGAEPGLNPRWLLREIMYQQIYVDASAAHAELDVPRGGVPEAIAEAVAASYP